MKIMYSLNPRGTYFLSIELFSVSVLSRQQQKVSSQRTAKTAKSYDKLLLNAHYSCQLVGRELLYQNIY